MDIITIIVLTGIANLTFASYSWQQVRNPESHVACKAWAQAYFIKAISFMVYAVALVEVSHDLRLLANIIILLGCWAEVRAYNKLAAAGIKHRYLVAGFVLSSVVFSVVHISAGVGPNHVTIVTASFLLTVPFGVSVYSLYKLSRENSASVFPKVLLAVNLAMMILCLTRGGVAWGNPDYIITQAYFTNQLFMFAVFISALGNGIGFLGFLKERSDEKLETRANIDYLTGIHNRQHFEKLTRALINSNAPFTLYFLDIDKFKSVNDRFGHATGDQVLQLFAQLLRQQQDQYKGVAGRLGGEEFGLLLPAQTADSHHAIIQQLRDNFATDAKGALGEALTFSVGQCASSDANSVHGLMRRADILLYQAKRKLHESQIAT